MAIHRGCVRGFVLPDAERGEAPASHSSAEGGPFPKGKRGARLMGAAEMAWVAAHYPEGTVDETIAAFSAEFGWEPSKATVHRVASAQGVRKARSGPLPRPVVCEDGRRFESAREAARLLGTHPSGITQACRRGIRCHGLAWRWADEDP